MSGAPIVCLGEVLIDCMADQPDRPLAAVESWTSYPGGAPANVACGLVKLGTPTEFIGAVGVDESGHYLAALLRSHQVGVRGLQSHRTALTRQVYGVRSATGDRSFAGFNHPDPTVFADAHIQADQIPLYILKHAQYLVLGTVGLAYEETRQAIQWAVAHARDSGVQIVVDVNWQPMFWPEPGLALGLIHNLSLQAHYLKLSVDEAEWLFETTAPEQIADRLPTVSGVLVTDGVRGCHYAIAGHVGHVPAFDVDSEDATGAGDAFLAGFLHQLVEQGSAGFQNADLVRQMIIYASAVGALATTRVGGISAQPSRQEVDVFLYLHQG